MVMVVMVLVVVIPPAAAVVMVMVVMVLVVVIPQPVVSSIIGLECARQRGEGGFEAPIAHQSTLNEEEVGARKKPPTEWPEPERSAGSWRMRRW